MCLRPPHPLSTPHLPCAPTSRRRHTCSAKDRSDYNKAPLLNLPVQREAEVVVLYHATVCRGGHAISYMLDGATSSLPRCLPFPEHISTRRETLYCASGEPVAKRRMFMTSLSSGEGWRSQKNRGKSQNCQGNNQVESKKEM